LGLGAAQLPETKTSTSIGGLDLERPTVVERPAVGLSEDRSEKGRSKSHFIPRQRTPKVEATGDSSSAGTSPAVGAGSLILTGDRCEGCKGRVYVTDKLSVEGKFFHKACFKCAHCNGKLSLGTYASLNGKFYCKPHFKQLFKRAGNYSSSFEADIVGTTT